MKNNKLCDILNEYPVVAAVKNPSELEGALASDCKVIFTLYGDIVGITEMVLKIKAADKLAMVHVDLIDGLAARDVAVDYIAKNTSADGILSTKPNLIRRAHLLGLLTIQRFFVLDSLSLANINKQLPLEAADAIEVLPGVMPKVINQLVRTSGKPIIAGGLIVDKEDIVAALDAGAIAISSTNSKVWSM